MDTSSNHVRIGKQDYPVSRLKLRAWLQLEDVRDKLTEATREKDRDSIETHLCKYVSIAISVPIDELRKTNWHEVASAFRKIYATTIPNIELPLIKPRKKNKEDLDGKFDYPNRSWYMWLHSLARCYGWTIEYIAELEINDAISLMQEILYHEQVEREWEWGMSEIAYPYDSNTKTSKFRPLKRPEWMENTTPPKEIKKVRMRASELPMGIILRWDDGTNTNAQ